MIFTQLAFALFFAVVFGVYWLLKGKELRKWWFIAASCFFYGYWDYRFLALILFCITFDFLIARALDRHADEGRRKALITFSVIVNLGFLGFFKYYNFFVDGAAQILLNLGVDAPLPTLRIALPVGISFFTFQSMSYTIDVYRRQIPVQKSFSDFLFFGTFFPQLVAGPIVRASNFLPQMTRKRSLHDIDVRGVLGLFIVGYFKKACVADNIAFAIDPVFSDPLDFGVPSRVLGALLYSVQIYCDFSGYTDMATAVAATFGFDLARNFDAPYLSKNIQEFWQRWHISLSSWLRDYLYIPLGGNRGRPWKVYRNLMLTMLLGGLWHGANWTFVLWGFLHGLALGVHRLLTHGRSGAAPGRAWALLGWAATFSWVVLCFTIFRASNIQLARDFFFGPPATHPSSIGFGWWLVVGALGGVHYMAYRNKAQIRALLTGLSDTKFYLGLGLVASALLVWTPQDLTPFIYFQF